VYTKRRKRLKRIGLKRAVISDGVEFEDISCSCFKECRTASSSESRPPEPNIEVTGFGEKTA